MPKPRNHARHPTPPDAYRTALSLVAGIAVGRAAGANLRIDRAAVHAATKPGVSSNACG